MYIKCILLYKNIFLTYVFFFLFLMCFKSTLFHLIAFPHLKVSFPGLIYIIVQIGHDVSGNFNIGIWVCSGNFIIRNT